MKTKIILTSMLFVLLALSACSPAQPTPAASVDNSQPAANGGGGQGQNGGGGPRNTLESRLAIGLLKLEGTGQAVTADQAKQLIPLWQQVKTLGANGGSQTDIQTAYTQIEKVLTTDQTTAIQNMSLSQTDIQDMMKTLGIQITPGAGGFGGRPNNGTAFPTMSADQRATRTAQRTLTPGAGGGGFGGRGGGFNQMFIDPLITLLQKRAGG